MSFDQNFYQKTKINFEKENTDPSKKAVWPKEWSTIYFKEYPRFPKIILPNPENLDFPLGEAILKRESTREFSNESIKLKDLSQILFYSAGILQKNDDWNKTKRAYPSGGARFPLEIYPIILNGSEEINEGMYHYNVKEHSLEKLFDQKNLKEKIYPTFIWQDMAKEAPLILVISAIFERNTMKYKERGLRYVFFEAGHLGQNIYLVCASLGIKCCAIGGFGDDKFNEILDMDGQSEGVMYIFMVGY